jgi:predicted amidohydrolase
MLNVSVFQGGHSAGVDNNIELLRQTVQTCPSKTDLIVFPELFIGGWGAGSQLSRFALTLEEVVSRVGPIAASRNVRLVPCLYVSFLFVSERVVLILFLGGEVGNSIINPS